MSPFLGTAEHEVSTALTDHDGGCVGVATGDRRHDRGVTHPETLDAADLEVRRDDGELVDAHPAGADAVVDRRRPAEHRLPELAADDLGARGDLAPDRA